MAGIKYKKADEVQINGNKIFSPVRKIWLSLTPEEQVRQQYLTVLANEYGYLLDQIDEEIRHVKFVVHKIKKNGLRKCRRWSIYPIIWAIKKLTQAQ
ncbi:MAG: hypothetical protein HGJ92_18305 [Desulfobacteraceae bacterium]|nr:hypothetical protein [Desulfobacteraceae bacterium]